MNLSLENNWILYKVIRLAKKDFKSLNSEMQIWRKVDITEFEKKIILLLFNW